MEESANRHISVVLDTNVFVAAYWAKSSASAKLIGACVRSDLAALYTPETRRETERILNTIRVARTYLDYLEGFWKAAREMEAAPSEAMTVDRDDQKFLEAAVGGDADFLVTNDEHLLSVGYVGRTEIITPGSLLRLLGIR